MGTFTVTDDDDLHTLTLSGADANEFEIVDNELKLKDEVSVDFETKSSYEVTVIATDSGGLRVNQRAKLTRVLGETALKSFHPRLYKIRYFIGASWSVTNGYYCGSKKAASCEWRVD
jgi:hypothetical protein